MKNFTLLAALAAILGACAATSPMPVIGDAGSGARVELGKGASIQGPVAFRADDGNIVHKTDGYIAIGR